MSLYPCTTKVLNILNATKRALIFILDYWQVPQIPNLFLSTIVKLCACRNQNTRSQIVFKILHQITFTPKPLPPINSTHEIDSLKSRARNQQQQKSNNYAALISLPPYS